MGASIVKWIDAMLSESNSTMYANFDYFGDQHLGQAINDNKNSFKESLKEHPTLFLAQHNPSNLTAKALVNVWIFLFKNQQTLNHSLGSHSRPTQTSFKSPSSSSKVNISDRDNL